MRAKYAAGVRMVRGLSLGAAAAVMFSCSGTPTVSHTSEPYPGPPIAVDSNGLEHILVLSAPSGGWGFIFDQARPAFEKREVYVTVVKPNPSIMQTMALVEQRMGTTVDKNTPIDVYARVIAYGADPSDMPYSQAAHTGH